MAVADLLKDRRFLWLSFDTLHSAHICFPAVGVLVRFLSISDVFYLMHRMSIDFVFFHQK